MPITTPGIVPIWEDRLSHIQPLADIKVWEATAVPSSDYFLGGVFDRGGIAKITSGNEFMIPAKGPMLVSAFAETITIEDHDQNFYAKQDMLFYNEAAMMRDWLYAIQHKAHPEIDEVVDYVTEVVKDTLAVDGSELEELGTNTGYTSGPYIDLSLQSEANKYYGLSDSKKSAWLQRSLARGVNIITRSITTLRNSTAESVEYRWGYRSVTGLVYPTNPGFTAIFDTYAEAVADAALGAAGQIWQSMVAMGLTPVSVVFTVPASDVAGSIGVNRQLIWDINDVANGPRTLIYWPLTIGSAVPYATGVHTAVLRTGFPVYHQGIVATQVFTPPKITYNYYDTCAYKQLGFTKIKGHGHYTLLGAFVPDDATAEAADYNDQCALSPKKRKFSAFVLGDNDPIDIPNDVVQACLPQTVTIDGQEFSYPEQSITLPPTSFLLQDGSIEPIYPIFPGAFVYDLQLKKWGKMQQEHALLLNYSPINTHAGDGPIPADIFSVNAGCLLTTGKIAIFDKYPADSKITYGKIGYYRNGYTDCEGVSVQFRTQATGSVLIEGSLDGKLINPAISQIKSYEDVYSYDAGFGSSARWFNVSITGYYDIKNIDFHGWKKGKR